MNLRTAFTFVLMNIFLNFRSYFFVKFILPLQKLGQHFFKSIFNSFVPLRFLYFGTLNEIIDFDLKFGGLFGKIRNLQELVC